MFALTLPEFVVGSFLRLAVKPVLGPPFPVGAQRLWLEVTGVLSQPPNGVTRTKTRLGGVPAVAVKKKGAGETGPVVLYLHGGAFVVGSHRTHQGLTGYLAKALDDGVVYSLDYRLAPENPWPAGADDALAAYRALVAKGVSPSRIVVAGDSAGGVMVADLLLALNDLGEEGPAGGVLLSPAVGIDMHRPDGIGKKDTFVTKAWAEQAMAGYARPTQDPKNRVLGRDLRGLPPLYLQFSQDELLAGENRTFKAELEQAGVSVETREDKGAFHVIALLPGTMKRARTSIEAIARFATTVTQAADRRPSNDAIAGNGAAKAPQPGHEVA